MSNIKNFFTNLSEKISKKAGANFRHLFSFPLSKLYSKKINEKLLVFGSTNGNAYAGNSKVVFEYLCEHSDYYCVWITASDKVYDELKKKNYNVVLSTRDIFRTIKILKSAKIIFISHGFGDITLIDFSPDTKIIYLAHGISFKKGGQDLEKPIMPFAEKVMNKIFIKTFDFFIDSAEETVLHKMTTYGLPVSRFQITGYPRNDILVNHPKEMEIALKRRLNVEKFDEILLYAPTFRDYKYKLPLTQDFLKNLMIV